MIQNEPCPTCGNKGYVIDVIGIVDDCPICAEEDATTCDTCDGEGVVHLEVKEASHLMKFYEAFAKQQNSQ